MTGVTKYQRAVSLHGSSHCAFDEPRGAKTVRYDSFVRDMTTRSVIPR